MCDKVLIENKIKSLYPGEPVTLLTEGSMSFACEVGDYIVRIPKNEFAAAGYKMEEKILNYLHSKTKTIELPDIKVIESPFFYTIHQKINGIYWDENTYIKKTEKEKDFLANDCALFFAELHSSDIDKIDTKLYEIKPIKDDIEKYLSEEFSSAEINKIAAYTDILYTLQDKCLVHNDFYHDNFFLDDNYRLKGVIDFANGGYYNYNFDFRQVISYEEGKRDFFERIVKFYEELTHKKIDIDIIKAIDVYNYISFLVYFKKNPDIKEEKIGIRDHWPRYIEYVKKQTRGNKIV